MFYLIWYAFSPKTELDGTQEKLFISDTQHSVFISYMVLYTMLTLLPQVILCLSAIKTKP